MIDEQKLIEILSIQSESHKQWRMFAYIVRQLKEMGVEYHTHNGNIYARKGDAENYPCVVAHMDTVHRLTNDLSVLRVGQKLTGFNRIKMEQTGIGGDDKVGVFIGLECLKKFENIKAAFFRDEEVGCEGSYKAKMKFFHNVGFVLQCDRNGNSDFIVDACDIHLSSYEFQSSIEWILLEHGYNFEYGMMTDVMALKESGLHVSCANMSCGYYHPHTEREVVNIDDVDNCLELVCKIITHYGDRVFPHTYYAPKYKSYKKTKSKKKSGKEDPYIFDRYPDLRPTGKRIKSLLDQIEGEDEEEGYCEICQTHKPGVKYDENINIEICDDCYGQYMMV